MDFKTYQERAGDTAMYPKVGDNYIYPMLGLVGEAGEIANKVKKIERDHAGIITDDMREMVSAELGDLLWYIARLATELSLDMETIAKENISKLSARKAAGVLHGSGDDR